jgi:gamma-glutamylcyclotransferase (GGCT)/AIG2-like uncharacterized protein YtfP
MELEYLFIYGVFREASGPILGDYIFCDRAFVFGGLWKVNDFYPGFTRNPFIGKVWGDIVLVDPSIFEKLDDFEGNEYRRAKIWTSIGIESWIYEWKGSVSDYELITSGDWIIRK